MTKYAILSKYDDSITPMSEWAPGDVTAHFDYLKKLNIDLVESGEMVDGQALAGPDAAKIVRSDGTVPAVTDGPFAEVKEMLAGYQIVDVESEERAVEIAALVSAAPGPGGTPVAQAIELRQVMVSLMPGADV
jgi:hypothetical protein